MVETPEGMVEWGRKGNGHLPARVRATEETRRASACGRSAI